MYGISVHNLLPVGEEDMLVLATSCWCVAIVLTCVGDSWDKLSKSTKDEGGDYSCEDLHDGCKLIKRN